MLTQEEIIEKIEENGEKIKSFGVKRLALFGSYAAGEATEESDLDFLVEFEEERGLFDDYIGVLHFLEDLFRKNVDLGEPELLRKEIREDVLGGRLLEAKI